MNLEMFSPCGASAGFTLKARNMGCESQGLGGSLAFTDLKEVRK